MWYCAAYPLNAVTLGNNMMAVFVGQTCPPLTKGESWWRMLFGAEPAQNDDVQDLISAPNEDDPSAM